MPEIDVSDPNSRDDYVRDNATSLIAERDAQIERQKREIAYLLTAKESQRQLIHRYRDLLLRVVETYVSGGDLDAVIAEVRNVVNDHQRK